MNSSQNLFKNSNIPKEAWEFDPHTIYEITIAPNDNYQGYNRSLELPEGMDRYTKFRKQLNPLLLEIGQYAHVYMVPEISEKKYANHGEFPRLHLHGIIAFKGKAAVMMFNLEVFRRISSIATVQFNCYRHCIWTDYIRKQHDKWMALQKVKPSYNYEFRNMEWEDIIVKYYDGPLTDCDRHYAFR